MRKPTKKQDELLHKVVILLRKSGDPNLRIIARHLKEGLKAINYLLDATDAARKKVPKQYEVQPVTLTSTNKKTANELMAAQWLIDTVVEQLSHCEGTGTKHDEKLEA